MKLIFNQNTNKRNSRHTTKYANCLYKTEHASALLVPS